ncbi:MAG: thiosulfate oxidation carrier protein SoxY [Acidiferrobacterales bacterium]
MKRRTFLRATVASSAMVVAAAAGLLKPTMVLAATWPVAAFSGKSVNAALSALYGTSKRSRSKDIKINASEQAEDGSSVPVAVKTTLNNIESISILVHKNMQPLLVSANITGGGGYVRTNIKMLKTSKVEFVVKADGKLYTASKNIKVTAGGCGG